MWLQDEQRTSSSSGGDARSVSTTCLVACTIALALSTSTSVRSTSTVTPWLEDQIPVERTSSRPPATPAVAARAGCASAP